MRKLERAIRLATEAHADVVDKAGLPYILHPLAVMMSKTPVLLGVPGSPLRPFTPDEMTVAVMHDVFEDAPEYRPIIEKEFEDHIIEALDHLTKRPHERYLEAVRRAMENETSHRVKLADNEHNMCFDRIICIPEEATRIRLTKKYAESYAILSKVV